jgi:hypothetical protein
MKKIFPILFICAGMTLLSVSCSKDYDASPDVTGKNKVRNPFLGDFTATINGEPFIANTKGFTDNTFEDIRSISIYGTMDSPEKDPLKNKMISLSIGDYTGPKAYVAAWSTSATYIERVGGNPTIYSTNMSGDTVSVINITDDRDKWEGTFTLQVKPSGSQEPINITQGAFSIPK